MNPRSLLLPPVLDVAPGPAEGGPAPALPGVALGAGRPALVAFLRHTGCPFAEATFLALRGLAAAHPGLDAVAVSHAPAAATAAWCAAVAGGPGPVRVVDDPDRRAYAAWGLPRTGLTHWSGRRSLREVGALARRGIRNRHADGTRWQSAGTFAVDGGGTVRWRHRPEHAGDVPDLGAAAAALGLGAPTPGGASGVGGLSR